jgi:hypothetical protein
MEASLDTDSAPETCEETDAFALKRRREAFRVFVDTIASHIQTLDLPETYLEAERAARAITVHDRAIETLPLIIGDTESDHAQAALKPIRRLLRRYADRVMEAVTFIPKPLCFLEGERAGRYALAADRMLAQLYEAPRIDTPKPAKTAHFADDDMDETDDEDTPNPRAEFMKQADRYTVGYARKCGLWPDGTPFDKEAPAPEAPWRMPDSLTVCQCLRPDSDPLKLDRFPARLMLNRVNAVTRAMARKDGRWPDHSPFDEDDPDYYDISARFDEQALNRPPPKDADGPPPEHKEIPNRIGFPGGWCARCRLERGSKKPHHRISLWSCSSPSPTSREGIGIFSSPVKRGRWRAAQEGASYLKTSVHPLD